MSGDSDLEDEIDVGGWNKMCKTISNAGFRDGAEAGRNAVFQKGFDLGYHEGYKNAHTLGYLKGAIRILNEDTKDGTTKSWDTLLQKTSRGLCQLCEKPEEERVPVCELVENQRQLVNSAVEKVKADNSALDELISDGEGTFKITS